MSYVSLTHSACAARHLGSLLRDVERLASDTFKDIFEALKPDDGVRLYLSQRRRLALSSALFCLCFFAFGRITENTAFLSHTLDKPNAYWGISRVYVADVILQFVE